MTLSPSAVHESAHAVSSVVLGLGAVDRVTLECTYFTDPTAWLHSGVEAAPLDFSNAECCRAAVIRVLSGPCAEVRITNELLRACLRRNSSDRATAVALVEIGLAPADRNEVLRGLLGEARALVEWHWGTILRLARCLEISRELNGFEVQRIVHRAQAA